MRFVLKPIVLIAFVGSACLPPAAPGASPGSSATPPATAGATSPVPSPSIAPTQSQPPSGDDVRLHGTFTGHYSDFSQDTNATYDVIVVWHRPNDIHDRLNFQFESGSFTYATTVSGVCGGSVTQGGPLELWGDDAGGLIYGDPLDRSHEVHGNLIDRRLNQGGLQFAFVADYAIPNGSVGCEPPYESHGTVPSCTMEFSLQTLDTLEPTAECTQGELTWTGTLVEI
ncbi:MAG: hypothetical protein ABI797_08385 [Chloroflexota bacterium]